MYRGILSQNKVREMGYKAHGQYLLALLENGVALVTDANCQIVKMFNIKNTTKIKRITWNRNWPNLAAIIFEKEIEVIISSMKI
jgi:transducin (beta)-like 1